VAGLVFSIAQIGDGSFCSSTPIISCPAISGSLGSTDGWCPVGGCAYLADRYTFTGAANQGVAIRANASGSGSFLGVLYLLGPDRSEERRVGKGCRRTLSSAC